MFVTTTSKSSTLVEGKKSVLLSSAISNIKTDCVDISISPFIIDKTINKTTSVPEQMEKGIEITTWQGTKGVGV